MEDSFSTFIWMWIWSSVYTRGGLLHSIALHVASVVHRDAYVTVNDMASPGQRPPSKPRHPQLCAQDAAPSCTQCSSNTRRRRRRPPPHGHHLLTASWGSIEQGTCD